MKQPKVYTPARLAELLARLRDAGVPVRRARLAPDGSLDVELADPCVGDANPFDFVEMRR